MKIMGNVRIIWFLVFFLLLGLLPVVSMADHAGVRIAGNLIDGSGRFVSVEEIEKLGITPSLKVLEPYEKKDYHFSGVWLDEFIRAYGKADTLKLELVAIDDYTITISRADWTENRILLVTKTNGKHIDFQSKGPVRIVYPFYNPSNVDEMEKIQQWIWMITDITFLK